MKRINYEDRKVLEKLLQKQMSKRAIGRAMNKAHTVILYELKYHRGECLPYDAERAQAIFERNQLKKGNVQKLEKNQKLRGYVLEKLSEDISPEQIAGRLKYVQEEQEVSGGYVCHETIYSFIYAEENRHMAYWKSLMRHRPKRIKKGFRRSKKGGTLTNIIPISKRPVVVETRKEIGHWESDSMIFPRQPEILSVQVERKTRLVRITKCLNKTANETKNAICCLLGEENPNFLKSITFDRGTEGAKHEEIREYLKVDTYFCDPYSSWQKGAVENRNMFIRRYFPRSTNMSEVTDDMIYEVQEKLNNRPMKCLQFRSPNEMVFFEKYNRFPSVRKKILLPKNIPKNLLPKLVK
jgi:transposase, IS30 family